MPFGACLTQWCLRSPSSHGAWSMKLIFSGYRLLGDDVYFFSSKSSTFANNAVGRGVLPHRPKKSPGTGHLTFPNLAGGPLEFGTVQIPWTRYSTVYLRLCMQPGKCVVLHYLLAN